MGVLVIAVAIVIASVLLVAMRAVTVVRMIMTTTITIVVVNVLEGARCGNFNQLDLKVDGLTRKEMIVVEVDNVIFNLGNKHLDLLTVLSLQDHRLAKRKILPIRQILARHRLHKIGTPLTVGLLRRKAHASPLADLHFGNGLVKTRNHVATANDKLEHLTQLVAVVELSAVIKRTYIVN